MTTRFDPLVTRASEPKIDWPETVAKPVVPVPEGIIDLDQPPKIGVTPFGVPEGVTPEQ